MNFYDYEAEDAGFEILDFPCNKFGNQAPGTTEEIASFCDAKFGITFKLFSKIEVNGENTHPLYKYLKEQKGFGGFDPNHPLTPLLESGLYRTQPDFRNTTDIKWNFTKFLIDRDGNVFGYAAGQLSMEMMESIIRQTVTGVWEQPGQ